MKKRFSGPQIVAKLRQADILIGQGKAVPQVCKEIEISQQTYYRWRKKYGGMSPDMVKQLRAVQRENAQLRKLVAARSGDPFAVQRFLGHVDLKMATRYVQDISKQTDRVIENSRKYVIGAEQIMTRQPNQGKLTG